MEANSCDTGHLDSDVLLPPRKRLLAGLRKQNCDGNCHLPSTSSIPNEFDNRLSNLTRSYSNNPNLSPEEIVETSRSAAEAAVKAAKIARAAAEEKAVIAAKAIAEAKRALELVATLSEEGTSGERNLKKNKMKKHLPVQTLYNKHRAIENCKTDEELARKLHRAINSSPRISKSSSTSELKNSKYKRLKVKGFFIPEKPEVSNGGKTCEGKLASTSTGNGVIGNGGSDCPIQESYTVRIGESASKFIKADRLQFDNEDAQTNNSKEKMLESSDDASIIGRKRGRIKQKKLLLSICTSRDRANPKEELKPESSPSSEDKRAKTTSNNMSLFSVENSRSGMIPVETTSTWKCQALKAPVCVNENKVVQS
ncbi:hypothetical protein NMG60_11007725 [Bertholletia excelsa]